MIAWLQGEVVDKPQPGKLVLNVHGVGYDVETSLQTFLQLEAHSGELGLYIHTLVREDAFLLYGFREKTERALFRSLIKVNGIGPKVAMHILSSVTPSAFMQAIAQENIAALTKLPGIGKKTAERLVIEMKDKVDVLDAVIYPVVSTEAPLQAMSALEALGYTTKEASQMVRTLDNGQKSCEELIRQSLQRLAKV